MIDSDAIEYAQPRLQARFGARPGRAAWRRIETIRELPALFEAARATAFRPLVAGLAPDRSVHELEIGLRAHWREVAHEVTGWLPGAWQRAAAWFAVIPDLPVIEHLLRGGAAYEWMLGDAVFGALAEADPRSRQRVLASSPLAGLEVDLSADSEPTALAEAWIAVLRARLPDAAGDEALHLNALGRVLGEHRQAIVTAQPGEAVSLRQALTARLEGLFRRAALTPAAGFCYLALAALDFLRLRGEIVRRAALPRLDEAA
ncbi:MAG: hypothetical protein LJE97_05645 [Betaproteobacteria bacterium]|jgi:hypothetical protein|nr:hypothetical protein [Betaproteobacteria bacterium]